MNSLITVITNLIRIYLIRKFIVVFFEETGSDKNKDIIVCGVFFIVNTGAYFAFHLSYINVICNIIGISALVLLRTKSVKIYFMVTYSVYLVSMLCDCIVVCAFVNYTEGESFDQGCIIIEIFFLYICELLAERIVCHRKKLKGTENIPLILVPLFCMVIIITLIAMHDEEAAIIVGIGLLAVNFFVIYLYDIMARMLSEKYENELLQRQIQVYENHLEIIKQSEEKVKSLRHDLKHHLGELKYRADRKEKDDVIKYIESMENFLQNPKEIVSSGNLETDSLLNYVLQRAREALNIVTVKVNIPPDIFPAFDINVILGNLLENAIEAAQHTEEKFLEVLIQYRQGIILIEIKNSFSGVINGSIHKLSTTKKDKERHGIGLSSVKQIVEKYNGLLRIEPQGNIFCVSITLYSSNFDNSAS